MSSRTSHRGTGRPDSHREWLQLVDADGPFLAVPVVEGVYPHGIPSPRAEALEALRDAKPSFERAWDAYELSGVAGSADAPLPRSGGEVPAALADYRQDRDSWVETVLREVLGWGGYTVDAGDASLIAFAVPSPDGRETVVPTSALRVEGRTGALVLVVDPVVPADDAASLRAAVPGSWSASPVDRMEAMLRAPASTCTIGVVTDGRWWAIVSAAEGTMPASGIVDALTWIEEPATRNAFIELLSVRRLLGGEEEDRLPAMFSRSVLAAEKITDALGVQVRRAVELLVAALSETARDAARRGEEDPLPEDAGEVYEAAVTVMMRIVFLLFAEERGLLPGTALFQGAYGMAGVLDGLDERRRAEGEESLEGTSLAWHRLLATSRALSEGANFEDTRLPAYGGSLFDASRFPWLTGTTERGSLRLVIPDRVMLHALEAVQVVRTMEGKPRRPVARRLSFRDIDVEQIGYVYEGLLGYTCRRAPETIVGLIGNEGDEPEIPLRVLDELAEEHASSVPLASAVLDWVKKDQPSLEKHTVSPKALAKAFDAGDTMEDADRALLHTSREDAELREGLRPWVGGIRRDLRGRLTVFQAGDVYVVETPSRKNAGAHYTPRSLAEEVVLHALEPLVYSPGPYQTPDRSQWRLLSSARILQLKVADIACGSGAFLVASARYLAARLVEAWQAEGSEEAAASLEHRAIREVVSSCLYGVDINEMAVEMCKLSLWLVSLDARLPFSFVDHKIRVGNSLLGITDLRQLRGLHIDPSRAGASTQGLFDLDDGAHAVDGLALDGLVEDTSERLRLLSQPVSEYDPQRSTRAKSKGLRAVDALTAPARRVADGVIAAGLELGGKPGRKLDEAYADLAVAVERDLRAEDPDPAMLDAILERGLTPWVPTDYERWECLHWPLVFPDVFNRGERSGFDAIVGNPPFLGGKEIGSANGANVREWIVEQITWGKRGNVDLSGYLLLRMKSLLSVNGIMGLIATNSIAQGDSRRVCLELLLEDNFSIVRSVRSRPWPTGTVAAPFATIWATSTQLGSQVERFCDGVAVREISSLLEPVRKAALHD